MHWTIFSLKNQCPCAKINSSINAKIRQKVAKIGTLSVISRITRASIIKLLMFMYLNTKWYLVSNKDIMDKYRKLVEIFSKSLVNHRLCVYHPSNNGHVIGPQNWSSFNSCLKCYPRRFKKKIIFIAFAVFWYFFYN